MYFLLGLIYKTIIHGQLLQMICLSGTYEDLFLQTGKVRRCQLGGDDQRQQHKQKKAIPKPHDKIFPRMQKYVLELSFIENNWGTLIGRVKMNKKAGCLALVKIIHHSSI